MAKLQVTLKKSYIGRQERQRKVAQALGLTKIGQTVVHEDNEAVRGAIAKIAFMLDVVELN